VIPFERDLHMDLKNFARFVAVSGALALAPVALAAPTEVKLDCPAGTVQKGGKVTKNLGVYCVKPGAQVAGQDVLHGPYVAFWGTGKRQAEGQYRDGARTGRWTYWDANGVKTEEIEFANGRYHGARTDYHANGKVMREQHWVDGKREGTETTYDAQGQKLTVTQLKGNRELRTERVGRAAK
jgi:hypothetical protein